MINSIDALKKDANRLSQAVNILEKQKEITPIVKEKYDAMCMVLEIQKNLACEKARTDFYVFRQIARNIHQPHIPFISSPFVKETARAFQSFYLKSLNGESPILMLQTPVQHGKSIMVIDFMAWLLGVSPNARVVFASFSKRLGVRANLALQRLLTHPTYLQCFPKSGIAEGKGTGKARNQEFLELLGGQGSFRNTTVGGQINGETFDVGIIDDVIKGRKEATSPLLTRRQRDWYFGNFKTRLQNKHSGQIIIGTPWEKQDLLATIKESNENSQNFTFLRFPAIATEDETLTGGWRKEGQALIPNLKDVDYLIQMQESIDNRTWQSLWQCNPVIEGGDVFAVQELQYYSQETLATLYFMQVFITMDTAEKEKEHNDFSVMCLWGATKQGDLYLLDMHRGKWQFDGLLREVRAFIEKYKNKNIGYRGLLSQMIIEDKSNGTPIISVLRKEAGLRITPKNPKGSKVERARAVSHHINRHEVYLPDWKSGITNPFIAELEEFSMDGGHRHDDIVDCLVYALLEVKGKSASIDIRGFSLGYSGF